VIKIHSVAIAFLASTCLPLARAQPAPTVRFDTNNYDSTWAVTGEVAGSIDNSGGALKVRLTRCILAGGAAFRTPTNVVSMFAEIRRPTTHSWSTGRRSEEHPIGRSLGRNEQTTVEPFDLTIPLSGFQLQGQDSIVFGMRLTDPGGSLGFVYLHLYQPLPGAPPVPPDADMGEPPKPLNMTGYPVPSLSLVDLEGKKHSVEDYSDKLVILDFWATWCGPCTSEMPTFERLHREFDGRNIVILTVNVSEEKEKVAQFIARNSYTFPVLLADRRDVFPFHITAFPTLAIVSKGRIAKYFIGGLSEQGVRGLIASYGKAIK
jgi:thiol-disulfide isomerase/thioredoxin